MKKLYLILIVILVIAAVAVGLGTRRHRLQPEVMINNQELYVALGDSVAAGQGLPTASDPSACERTDESYPVAVAKTLNLKLDSVACSGATIAAGLNGPQTVNELALPTQLSHLFATTTAPKLITLTIGANDVDWSSLIGSCFLSTCGTPDETAAVTARLATLRADLGGVLAQIRQQYGQKAPRVVVTGYYQVFAANKSTCTDLSSVTTGEIDWWRTQATGLNKTISDVTVGYSFAKFAPVDFTGHELCSAEPWTQDISASAPFHPTAAGQEAIAQAVAVAYAQFSK